MICNEFQLSVAEWHTVCLKSKVFGISPLYPYDSIEISKGTEHALQTFQYTVFKH